MKVIHTVLNYFALNYFAAAGAAFRSSIESNIPAAAGFLSDLDE
jgi:hypothetical protein